MMDLYRIIKREPIKKSKFENFMKVVLVIGSIAAISMLALTLYKKWKECNVGCACDDDFDDEWFCDCDECSDEYDFDDETEDIEPECVACPDESQAEVEYEEKEDKEI